MSQSNHDGEGSPLSIQPIHGLDKSSDTPNEKSKNPANKRQTRPNRKPDSVFPSWIPKVPLFCLILHLASMVGAIIIVYTSNTRQVGHWIPNLYSIQPSVLLAILAGVSNTSLDFSLSGGIAIVWWRSALKRTTLGELHYIWNKGDWESLSKFIKAFASGYPVKKVILATVVVAITKIANNPLLQRATHATQRTIVSELPWTWALAQSVPDGWVGSVGGDGYPSLVGSPSLQRTAQEWQAGVPISNYIGNCDGNCTGFTTGAGITASCFSNSQFVDVSTPGNENVPVFGLDFTRFDDINNGPTLNLTVKYTPAIDSSCNATIITETCAIQSAIVKYKIKAQEKNILDLEDTPTVLSLKNNSADSVSRKPGYAAGLLTGLEWVGYYYLHANATIQHNVTSDTYSYEPTGLLASQYYDSNRDHYPNLANCAFQWQNPTEDILKNLHQISMRIAFASSNGTPVPPNDFESVMLSQDLLVYESVFPYLWAAVGMMILAMGFTIWTLWKCWELKEPVTLSPLETGWSLGALDKLRDIGASSLILDEMLLKEETQIAITLRRPFSGGE